MEGVFLSLLSNGATTEAHSKSDFGLLWTFSINLVPFTVQAEALAKPLVTLKITKVLEKRQKKSWGIFWLTWTRTLVRIACWCTSTSCTMLTKFLYLTQQQKARKPLGCHEILLVRTFLTQLLKNSMVCDNYNKRLGEKTRSYGVKNYSIRNQHSRISRLFLTSAILILYSDAFWKNSFDTVKNCCLKTRCGAWNESKPASSNSIQS